VALRRMMPTAPGTSTSHPSTNFGDLPSPGDLTHE
jgi:hypothetical protein